MTERHELKSHVRRKKRRWHIWKTCDTKIHEALMITVRVVPKTAAMW